MTKNVSSTKTWKAMEDGPAVDAEMERIVALSDDALDAELTAAGFDVPALDAKNAAFIEGLQKSRATHGDAADSLRRARALIASRAPRAAKAPIARRWRTRITTARNDPRFSAPAAILFRNRETKEATDEELVQLLLDTFRSAGRDRREVTTDRVVPEGIVAARTPAARGVLDGSVRAPEDIDVALFAAPMARSSPGPIRGGGCARGARARRGAHRHSKGQARHGARAVLGRARDPGILGASRLRRDQARPRRAAHGRGEEFRIEREADDAVELLMPEALLSGHVPEERPSTRRARRRAAVWDVAGDHGAEVDGAGRGTVRDVGIEGRGGYARG